MAERIGGNESFVVKEVKTYFFSLVDIVKNERPEANFYLRHTKEVEGLSRKVMTNYPSADEEVLLLSVWLHDVGNIIGKKNIDHSINSEIHARKLLKEMNFDHEKIEAVAHCVRSHRNIDILPRTIEAKILAASTSACYMTSEVYLILARKKGLSYATDRLNKDYQNSYLIPELGKSMGEIYRAWKKLFSAYSKLV